ncbi:hypothetical protein BS50DRAFT_586210 [Corynespora cassiicola Philippines]|uniref:Uncharacterized protein n=1 Tax=Corynespora cassiicola Philippines TaxID=1448308 RepID=A0A2T2NTT0_CORCC|nr:hypothetical protein BS50DRAFT_586210 [Corynespora cassiicola Philippines]
MAAAERAARADGLLVRPAGCPQHHESPRMPARGSPEPRQPAQAQRKPPDDLPDPVRRAPAASESPAVGAHHPQARACLRLSPATPRWPLAHHHHLLHHLAASHRPSRPCNAHGSSLQRRQRPPSAERARLKRAPPAASSCCCATTTTATTTVAIVASSCLSPRAGRVPARLQGWPSATATNCLRCEARQRDDARWCPSLPSTGADQQAPHVPGIPLSADNGESNTIPSPFATLHPDVILPPAPLLAASSPNTPSTPLLPSITRAVFVSPCAVLCPLCAVSMAWPPCFFSLVAGSKTCPSGALAPPCQQPPRVPWGARIPRKPSCQLDTLLGGEEQSMDGCPWLPAPHRKSPRDDSGYPTFAPTRLPALTPAPVPARPDPLFVLPKMQERGGVCRTLQFVGRRVLPALRL